MASGKTYNAADCKQQLLWVQAGIGTYGGYKQDLLIKSLSDLESDFYVCTTCDGIMRNACIIEDGHNLVCDTCVLKGKKALPMEKSREKIHRLTVKCPLENRGCEWGGKMEEIEIHINECTQFVVNCSNICGVILKRSEQKNHCEIECINRSVSCMHCKVVMPYKDVEIHFITCPDLPLLCTNECMETFLRIEMNAHIQNDCPNTLVDCTNECGLKLKRSNLSTHCKEECQLKKVTCKYCQVTIQNSEYETHYKICLQFPLVCSNQCLETVPRRELQSHIKNECPNTVFSCPYKEMGCKMNIKRCELQEHEKSSETKHLDLTVICYSAKFIRMEETIQFQDKTNEQLADRGKNLVNSLMKAEKENGILKDEIKNLKKQVLDIEKEKKMDDKITLSEKDIYVELQPSVKPIQKQKSPSAALDHLLVNKIKGEFLPLKKAEHLKIGYLYRFAVDLCMNGWKRNLIALTDGAVQYYYTARDYINNKVRGTLRMSVCDRVSSAVPPNCSSENGFVVRIGGKANYFIADTVGEAKEWLELLSQSKEEHYIVKPKKKP